MDFHGGQFQQELCVLLQSWDHLPCEITSRPHSASCTYLSTYMLEISVTYHLLKSFYSLFTGSVSAPFFFSWSSMPVHMKFLGFHSRKYYAMVSHFSPSKITLSLSVSWLLCLNLPDRHCLLHSRSRWKTEWFLSMNYPPPQEETCVLSVYIPQYRIRNLEHAFS